MSKNTFREQALLTGEERAEYLAYKLLEWAQCCEDKISYQELPKTQKDNAIEEAKSILKRLEETFLQSLSDIKPLDNTLIRNIVCGACPWRDRFNDACFVCEQRYKAVAQAALEDCVRRVREMLNG